MPQESWDAQYLFLGDVLASADYPYRYHVTFTVPDVLEKTENTEIYDSGRYFTLTGNHLPGTPRTIEQRQSEQMQVYERLAPRDPTTPLPGFSQTQADAEVLEKAQRARNGQDFTTL